jgi:hypothetical protein
MTKFEHSSACESYAEFGVLSCVDQDKLMRERVAIIQEQNRRLADQRMLINSLKAELADARVTASRNTVTQEAIH